MKPITEEKRQLLIESCNHIISEQPNSPYGVIAKIALASLEAEPKRWLLEVLDDTTEEERWFRCDWYDHEITARKNQRVIAWYTAPPVPVMQLVELPDRLLPANHRSGEAFMAADSEGNYLNREFTIKAIRAAGYEVKE